MREISETFVEIRYLQKLFSRFEQKVAKVTKVLGLESESKGDGTHGTAKSGFFADFASHLHLFA